MPQQQPSRPDALVLAHAQELKAVLPSHLAEKGDGWISGAIAAVRKNPDLWNAARNDPGSLMNSLSEAARLGLQPGTTEYYLTPRKSKNGPTVLGIVGYQGEIELIYRAGAVSSVIAEVVRDSDKFAYRPGHGVPEHDIDWDAEDRGGLRLVYAYCIMKDGSTSRVVVMNKADIAKIKAASDGANSSYSPWNKWEEAMWLKSAIHQLEKWVPTSAEYIREQLRAEREVAAEDPRPAPDPEPVADMVTGELVDEGEQPAEQKRPAPAQPEARNEEWGEFPDE